MIHQFFTVANTAKGFRTPLFSHEACLRPIPRPRAFPRLLLPFRGRRADIASSGHA